VGGQSLMLAPTRKSEGAIAPLTPRFHGLWIWHLVATVLL